METIQERSAIEDLIFSYQDAFNAKDVSKAVSSFTPEGINMPNNAPTSKGTEQLTAVFEFLFNYAAIDIQYAIDEISITGETAYARTNSQVTTVVKASGERIFLENKEVFMLSRLKGEWKISLYIFNNTKTTK